MKVGKVLVVALCLVWSVTTANQVFRWGHPLHLWKQAIEESPDKPRPWNNLGAQYLLEAQHGEYDRALGRLTPVMHLYKLQETIAAHAWITRQKIIASQ